MKHIGNLEITEKNANLYGGLIEVTGCLLFYGSAKLDALQTVGGDLQVYGSAKLDALQTVGGYLHVYGSAKLDAPALQTVGGDLQVDSSAKLDALQTVGGDLQVDSSAKLDALQTVGGDLQVDSSAKLDAPALQTVGGEDVSGGKIKFAKTPVWTAICTPNMLRIGCQSHAWDDWIEMSDEEISKLDYRASEIAKKYRAKLLAIREELRGK